jgi:L-amino acid N-acyltransferase YncA
MEIRPYRREDEAALAGLSATCARGEGDFVLNPIWENADEFTAEFRRFDIAPETHVIVAEEAGGETIGFAGFLRRPESEVAGLICPIVKHGGRRRGVGGELLRAAQELANHKLGIRCATAGIGTRNRAGYSLLASHGFRPVRQHFLMRCDIAPQVPELTTEGFELDLAQPDDCDAILEIYHACGFESRPLEVMRTCLQDGRTRSGAPRRRGGRLQRTRNSPTKAGVGRLRGRERRPARTWSRLGAGRMVARATVRGGRSLRHAVALPRQPHCTARVREGRLPTVAIDRCARKELLATGAGHVPFATSAPYSSVMADALEIYREGFRLFADDQHEAALEKYREALALDPNLAIAWNALSMALRQQGDLDGALEAGRKLIELEPDDALSHTNLSILLQMKGMIDEAEDEKAEAMQLEMKARSSS